MGNYNSVGIGLQLLIGPTGNIVRYHIHGKTYAYFDKYQRIWPNNLNENIGLIRRQSVLINEPFNFGGLSYNRFAHYDKNDELSDEYKICRFVSYNQSAKMPKVIIFADRVYVINLNTSYNNLVYAYRLPFFERADFVYWNIGKSNTKYIIKINVGNKIYTLITRPNFFYSAKIKCFMEIDTLYKIEILSTEDYTASETNLPDLSANINCGAPKQFEEITYYICGGIVFSALTSKLDEIKGLSICRKNSTTLEHYKSHDNISDMLMHYGFKPAEKPKFQIKFKEHLLDQGEQLLERYGLYVQFNQDCIISGYEYVEKNGRHTKVALRDLD
jgi:hypothetical protein